tara:strand:+ start:2131 stop:2277 length:147 start_codon:yes stop_codon:yes gene_type:complete
MPTLTFVSPESAADAVVNKRTGYSVWDSQDKIISDKMKLGKWNKVIIK